ncbi:hypothetical protein BC828DRAFT_396815 [Blastocladiella britannica]|nr:hypothetical protein BC828DRAFT_396815 [Blastocladiella britannica]
MSVSFLALLALIAVVNAATDPCGGTLRQRKSFYRLTDVEKAAYATGVKALKVSGKWDYFNAKHRSGMKWHSTTQFLPMHRALLLEFETELLKVAPGLTGLPFWNEYQDSPNPLASSIFDTTGLAPMVAGPLGEPFKGLKDDKGQLVARSPDLGASGSFQWVPRSEVMATALGDIKTFGELSHAIEVTPHNAYHSMVGGQMGAASSSPADPLFFLHHAYIDALWAAWQSSKPEHFADLTVPGQGPGDLQVKASEGTAMYEKQYTNRDMVYYRQRLCYEYKMPPSLRPVQRAQKALDDGAIAAAAGAVGGAIAGINSTTFAPITAIPIANLKQLMPMFDDAQLTKLVADNVALFTAAAVKLNAYIAANVNATNPPDVVLARLLGVSDYMDSSFESAKSIKDDFKDSSIPAVQTASPAGSATTPSSARALAAGPLVIVLALVAALM